MSHDNMTLHSLIHRSWAQWLQAKMNIRLDKKALIVESAFKIIQPDNLKVHPYLGSSKRQHKCSPDAPLPHGCHPVYYPALEGVHVDKLMAPIPAF